MIINKYNRVKLMFNIFAPFAFCEFMLKLSNSENNKQAFGWSDLGGLRDYSVAWCILFLLIDAVIYLVISLYLEKVIPSK
jgi:hypothetical protein